VRTEARARIERLLEAARRIADPEHPLGREARQLLPGATRLSAAGVELALERCLELSPSESELARLCESVAPAARAHVLLSANVFTAAHRAIALALACSDQVFVRPSRRAPELARLLSQAAPGLFALVERLDPSCGDAVFGYGSDETLDALKRQLSPGIRLAAHGAGYGIAALESSGVPTGEFASIANQLALDVALFDQRGCLSPRLVLFEGPADPARAFASVLSSALSERAVATPFGEPDDEERAELARQRRTLAYAGEILPSGPGFVALLQEFHALPEITGRSLAIVTTRDAVSLARRLERDVTTYAAAGTDAFRESFARALPRARCAEFGALQTPPLDGPVDLRTRWCVVPE
jgi:hypothetical protein